jgi:type I restriction enzyme S subunit
MARALFKDWFVDFGPVRAKMEGRDGQDGLVSGQRHGGRASGPTEPYLPADLWQLFPDRLDDEGKPEGWIERPLDEIADFLNGLALQKFPVTDPDDSLPVIKIAELRNGVSAKSDRASREVPVKYIIKDGDFLFSWSGSLLAKFWTEGEGALNQHLFKVTSERYPMWFVSHWVHHHLEEFQAIAASKATTMGHIQRGHLKAAMTLCPPDDVLARLGVVMAPLVEQTIQNELESRNLAHLRDTLLPKLISGELRINEVEKLPGM